MTPLLLIPGMMCDARMWGDLPAHLAADVRHALPTTGESVWDSAIWDQSVWDYGLTGRSYPVGVAGMGRVMANTTSVSLWSSAPLPNSYSHFVSALLASQTLIAQAVVALR